MRDFGFKLILMIALAVLLAGTAAAGYKTGVWVVFDNETLSASASADSSAVNVSRADGVFSYVLKVIGAGSSVKIEYLVATDEDGPWYSPGTAAADNDLVTSFGPTSGPAGDGVQAWWFSGSDLPCFPWWKFRATETAGNAVTKLRFVLALR